MALNGFELTCCMPLLVAAQLSGAGDVKAARLWAFATAAPLSTRVGFAGLSRKKSSAPQKAKGILFIVLALADTAAQHARPPQGGEEGSVVEHDILILQRRQRHGRSIVSSSHTGSAASLGNGVGLPCCKWLMSASPHSKHF